MLKNRLLMAEIIAVLSLTVLVGYSTPVFKVGDCACLNRQPGLGYNDQNIVRVESYKDGHYVYRWYVIQGGWALDTNDGLGDKDRFERNFHQVECPKK